MLLSQRLSLWRLLVYSFLVFSFTLRTFPVCFAADGPRLPLPASAYTGSLAGFTGFMFTGAAVVSGAGDGKPGMLEGLVIEKLNGWDIEKR